MKHYSHLPILFHDILPKNKRSWFLLLIDHLRTMEGRWILLILFQTHLFGENFGVSWMHFSVIFKLSWNLVQRLDESITWHWSNSGEKSFQNRKPTPKLSTPAEGYGCLTLYLPTSNSNFNTHSVQQITWSSVNNYEIFCVTYEHDKAKI